MPFQGFRRVASKGKFKRSYQATRETTCHLKLELMAPRFYLFLTADANYFFSQSQFHLGMIEGILLALELLAVNHNIAFFVINFVLVVITTVITNSKTDNDDNSNNNNDINNNNNNNNNTDNNNIIIIIIIILISKTKHPVQIIRTSLSDKHLP